MEKQWKLFTRQMIRTHQLLTSLLQKPSALTQLLLALEAELSNLNSIHTSYQPLIQVTTQLLKKELLFDGVSFSSKHMRRSLLPFLGDTLSWLTGTATAKDGNDIKTRINQLIATQCTQQEIIVHIISILNVTRYATQVNRQHFNIMMDAAEKMHQDISKLYNIMHSLYISLSYQQIILHIQSILGKPPGFSTLHEKKSPYTPWMILMQQLQEYSHCMCYIVEDLMEMLSHIEEMLPSTMPPTTFIRRCTPFLQISMYPCPDC